MNLFDLQAKLTMDSSGYESGISMAQQSLFGFENALKTFVMGYAVKKFVGLAKDAVTVGMSFDSAMSQVAATMGTTTEEIKNLRDFAMEMGSTTKFSAVEAAQALNYMALAGYDAEKSMSMLPTVLNLAAAGGFDLARASDMVTDAESALGLTTEQTAVMVDQMARTASQSNTSVEQLGDAMLTIGGTAKFMAGGTDRLQTVLGLLADNGIKGSEAGTHLRNMLLKLSSPTKDGAEVMERLGISVFDAEGNMRDMQDIMYDMGRAMENLTEQERIQAISDMFNARDIAAVNALLGTSTERWDELGKSIADSTGSAQQMSETQLGNLTGDITIMKSALEGVKIQFSDGITPAIRDLVKRLTGVLSNPKTQKFLRDVGKYLGEVIKRITEIVSNVVLPRLISLFDNGARKLKIFGGVALGLVATIKTVSTVMGVLAGTLSPTGLLLKGLGLLVGAFVAADLAQDDYIENMRYLTDADRDFVNSVNDAVAAHEDAVSAYNDSATAILDEKNRISDLWAELQTLTGEEGNVKHGMEERANFIIHELNEALGLEMKLNNGVIQGYKDIQAEIDNLIAKQAAEALMAAAKDSYTAALQEREAALQRAGEAHDKLAEAQAEYAEQQQRASQAELTMQSLRRLGYDEETEAMWNARDARDDAEAQMEELTLQINKYRETYELASEDAGSYYSEVERYEKAQSALLRGNYEEAERLMTKDLDYSIEAQRRKATANDEERQKYETMLKQKRSAVEEYRRQYLAGEEGFHLDVLQKLEQGLLDEIAEAKKIGINVADSIGSGLIGRIGKLQQDGALVIRSITQSMKAEAQIASPSKVGRKIGENIGSSVGLGLEDSEDFAERSAANLTKGVLSNLEGEASFGSNVSARGSSSFEDAIIGILQDIRDNLGFDMVLEDGTLIGRIDRLLGQSTLRKARGNA